MTKEAASNELTFARACEYLSLSPDDLVALREQGLVACLYQGGKQVYPKAVLDITRRLLSLGRERNWSNETLAWYADLVFATEVGRAILLPIKDEAAPLTNLPASWLETPYIAAVLIDLDSGVEAPDSPFTILLRGIVTVSIGEKQFWADAKRFEDSALYPLIVYLEAAGIPILNQGGAIARDAAQIFLGLLHAFTAIAPPISSELGELVSAAQSRLKGSESPESTVSPEDQVKIRKEALVAVDKFYAGKVAEIHTPPDAWDIQLGVASAQKRTISLQMKLPLEASQDVIDNIIDLIRPYVGSYGARVVQLLYEIANDPPYWRNPLITVDTNELLDRLGVKRDSRNVHYSRNRERLRDVLNTAHYLEIVGEYTSWENGQPVVRAMRRTVLSLIGATFDPSERQGLSTSELFQRGLPKSMQIRLNFYEGVRRQDGRLGNQYVLMPRLAAPKLLPKANHAATEEMLKAYLLFRYRQTRMESRSLTITRGTALEKAGIKTKNVTWATRTLVRALDRLVSDGTLEEYSAIPLKVQQSFTVVLSPLAVQTALGEPE